MRQSLDRLAKRAGARRSNAAQRHRTHSAGPHRAKPAWPNARSHLAAIVEYSNDAVFTRTFGGLITTWNAAAERIFGYTAAEIVGRATWVLLPPGTKPEFRKLIARLRRGKVIEHFETERVRKDGRRIHVSLTLSPLRDSSGQLIGFSTIARDITERHRVRETLERREAELEDLFESASVGLVLVSPEGLVQRANPTFLSIVNRSAGQVVNRPLNAFHPDGAVMDDLLKRLAIRGTIHNFATELIAAKAQTRHVLIDADGFWEAGRLVRSRWFVRDISRRHQLERQLLENSEAERRAFAQELHDGLGQQLGGIAYLVNVLREDLQARGAGETPAATRIFELVRKAIDDARRMARGLSPIPEVPDGLPTALRELAAQTSELKGIRCRAKFPKPVLVANAALASHFYRIAQEAVNNAVKHAAPRNITISLSQGRDQLKLTVTDDGKGIGPLSPNRTRLGLRIMQHRAGLIGGAMEIAARRPRGTRVSCAAPLLASEPRRKRD